MKRRHFLQTCALGALSLSMPAWAQSCPLLGFTVRTLDDDKEVNLCKTYAGDVVLVVNTASFCGFTPQFKGLEQLYGQYKDQGLAVLGFPSNDFAQDPKDEKQIKDFCELTYGVKFPMFAKSKVRKDDADPLFKTPVYCFALGGTFRAFRLRQDKAPCAGNGHTLGKHGNAVMAHSEGSLRASRWPIICGVAPACKGVALAARARLASNQPAAR